MKVCRKCDQLKELVAFHIRKAAKDGHHHTCKACRKSEPRPSLESRRSYMRRKNYGLDDAGFHALLLRQDNRCAICRSMLVLTKEGLHIDHCHSTGRVRGLLCGPCNAGIGHLKDSADLCQSAAAYLKNA